MAGSFELKKAAGGKFMFNLKAANGEIVLTSQTYASRGSAILGVESVRKNAAQAARFERKVAKNGSAYFVLMASNGKQIGRSETFSSESGMENAIASIRKSVKAAKLEERK
jgi:uncharacterized protein YegP (UPF0339 family)